MSTGRPVPRYSRHSSGQARVRINGRTHYLGKYGSPASREKYGRLIAEWLTTVEQPAGLTMDDIAIGYREYAHSYYVKNGELTGHLSCIEAALGYLVKEMGAENANNFTARKLKALREKLIERGLSRRYINDLVAVLKRAMRWAASEELISPNVPASLQTVDGLRRGRSSAKEYPPVLAVDEKSVKAILPHISKQVAAMVQLQLYTGMRPCEVLPLRPQEITRRDDGVWEYRPSRNKSEHKGLDRIVFIGPKGQAVLSPWLDREHDSFCFQPKESDRRHRNKRGPGETYRRDSYRTAIQRACRKAKVEPWTPNQLRHTHATLCRQRFGLEGSQVVLGHVHANVSEIYAERDLKLAANIQRELG